ncbi:MBL fold metallo-hydrolase [Xanthomonas fragariae]|nr:MBL fold metallo-hydrolase [Xanthomonas fragariae]UKR52676.1 MBL fold metallo-hydrolase [Xanthomonas fragariae]
MYHKARPQFTAVLAHVDAVLLTHLHVDHTGWNTVRTDNGWAPTFPNARYVYARAEENFYATAQGQARRSVFSALELMLLRRCCPGAPLARLGA